MTRQDIRNVAIIAHVDHGKTTLVDQLLRQSGQFRQGELTGECILDSNPIERERGITILAKNCAIEYTDRRGDHYHINIVDTPGHADFSGEVERVLMLADGVLLIVDAFEGVMPQTRYVLDKALDAGLKPIVVFNKMDRADAGPAKALDEVFDLLVDLGADDHALDFPTIYASAKEGWATTDPAERPAAGQGNIHALFDAIIKYVPVPALDADAPLQALITTLDYSDYVGRIGIGRVFAGTLRAGQDVAVIDRHGHRTDQRVAQLFRFDGLGRTEVDQIDVGDLCAVVGLDKVDIGDTLADPERPEALPPISVDEPTLHMTFRINDGPFAGRDGKYVTSRQLRERLQRELQSNVALEVEERGDEFIVSGRGLLHLGILLENMRREGYELTVGKPEVIYHQEGGQRLEPIEALIVDVPNQMVGAVMQLVGDRRAEIVRMHASEARTHMSFSVPARGLIGLRGRLLTATQGEAIVHHRFQEFAPYRGDIPGRANGTMIAMATGRATAYAIDQLASRGVMFVAPGDQVYEGQVVGEHCKPADITVNITRQKRLNNIRSSTKEATVTLKAPHVRSLEAALEYIEEDELVELTPKAIRLRKRRLSEIERRRRARAPAGSANEPAQRRG
ncbi:MAG TPA: translational GTPase TypA [Planctomycetota bacterium]|nr:translational GTPase TypA [Planctomycetota bacterium]